MSSTGRGRAREASDNYPTPAWCVDRLLEAVPLPGVHWLEPCAGEGSIIRAVQARRHDVTWTAVEFREECRWALEGISHRLVIGDFFTGFRPSHHDVVITNPPYSLAQAFVEESRLHAAVVVALLRVNFLASEERQGWLSKDAPDVYVLPNRPCFVNGKSDSCEYAWMVWQSLPKPVGTVRVLASTPKSERLVKAGTK